MGQTKAVAGVGAADELEEVAQRFERWRLARRRGEHIPRELWAQAVCLGVRYGVHRVAASLGLNAERLQRRVRDDDGAATETPEPVAATDFVELVVASPEGEVGAAPMPSVMPPVMPPIAPPACVLELRNARGATLRLELATAQALSILPGLCAAFAGA